MDFSSSSDKFVLVCGAGAKEAMFQFYIACLWVLRLFSKINEEMEQKVQLENKIPGYSIFWYDGASSM